MDSTEGLKDEQTRILNEVLQASHQKEVVDQHLRKKKNTRHENPWHNRRHYDVGEVSLGTFF